MPSIRQKITLGYYAFAAIVVLLAVFAYLDLEYLEQRIEVDAVVSRFFDATLEMRRDEKNYFLYGEEATLRRARDYAAQAATLLDNHPAVFLHYAGADRLARLGRDLGRFQELFRDYERLPAAARTARDALEREIRLIGRNISLEAGAMNTAERADLRAAVGTTRRTLVISVVLLSLFGIGVGQVLSRRVVRPLRMLEESMSPIAAGRFKTLDLPVRDREIVSFENAFNRMLQERDLTVQQLIQSEKLAALGTLVSGVAHELNNPLANISSSCQILLEEIDGDDAALKRELLEQIEQQTERARRTVLALLDFSRQGRFQREPVALAGLVRQTLEFLKGQIPPGVTIRIEVPDDLVLGLDRRKMQQAVLNLVKNALDAIGDTGTIRVSAKPCAAGQNVDNGSLYVLGDQRCELRGDAVVLTVEDSGPGIPPEIVSRIFDPFFTTRDVGRGSGLGLYIVAEIVRQHQGCIGVASEPGRGTRFLIKLPVDTPAGNGNTGTGV